MLSCLEKIENQIAGMIIAASIEVHKQLGPGLLEKAYEACLAYELTQRDIQFMQQVPISVKYKQRILDCGFRADMIIKDRVLVEIKSVASIADIHRAQALTYLKLTGLHLCLILNFNSVLMKNGIERIVLGL